VSNSVSPGLIGLFHKIVKKNDTRGLKFAVLINYLNPAIQKNKALVKILQIIQAFLFVLKYFDPEIEPMNRILFLDNSLHNDTYRTKRFTLIDIIF